MKRIERKKEEQPNISDLDKAFLSAVTLSSPQWITVDTIDHKKCEQLLAKGANINAKFGKYAMNDIDACSFCGPNDRPLTHAIKRENVEVTEFLLNHGADTEVVNGSDDTPLMDACFRSGDNRNRLTKLLLDHGANPNAKNHEKLTAMHMIFLGLREWLVDKQRKPAAEAATLLLDAGFVGDVKEIEAVLTKRGYMKDPKIVETFQQICDDVNMAARLEANKKEYDYLKKYLDENPTSSGKKLLSKSKNILRDQEAIDLAEKERHQKEIQKAAKRLAEVTKKIDIMHKIPASKNSTVTYNPVVPFHQQAVILNSLGGDFNLLGIPYTNKTVYYKPLTINDNVYYISSQKKTEIGRGDGVFIYNKLSFEVIDVATKKMLSDIDPKDIDSTLRSLHDQSQDLTVKHNTL